MSKRQIQKMLRLMASGEPVELTSAMASVKKLARLAFLAQQFGYEYADVRQGGANNSALVMLIVPDPGPQARTRAAQNWAQYPNAGDGVNVPPFVPDAVELLKARINFDLTGKSAEKRMVFGAIGVTVGCVAAGLQDGADLGDGATLWAGVLWAVLMGIFAIGVVVTRRRNRKYAARLQAAGYTQVADETGRLRYLPPGGLLPGHGNPFAGGPAGGNPLGGNPVGGNPFATGPAPGPYTAPAPGAPYPQQPPAPHMPQQAPQAYPQQYQQPQQPHSPQQSAHWQPPRH